ncbi:MAG: 30S ribosomal protein S16 [Candidatus Peribacteraceae bacterium]|nr:30S ribosomal protein S16 [Candidatus Peribacteraceae bacterium]MDD5074923.1 30S ribosomal protein S16 [Candidatus Peribacteraceae bacterium]
MLVIRLQRTGRSKLPAYRLVLAEKARPVKGKFLEILGHSLPARDSAVFECNQERILHWIKSGAIPSNTAARLLRKAGMKDMEKFIETYTKKKSKKAPPEGEVAAAAPAPAAAEAPKTEAPAA